MATPGVNHTGQQLSRTGIGEIKFNHTWEIRNFRGIMLSNTKVTSLQFQVPDYPTTGYVFLSKKEGMKLSYTGVCNDVISATLHVNLKSVLTPLSIGIEASVLNTKGQKIKTSKREMSDIGNNSMIVFDEFVTDENMQSALENDTVMISCNFAITHRLSANSTYPLQIYEHNLVSDFENLLINPRNSDMTITVGSKKFKVHKLILASRSPVFAAMFGHEMRENEENNIDLTDMSEEVVEEMLKFIYADKAEKLGELTSELLDAAEKYDLQRLRALCVQRLGSNLTYDNAAEQLIMADRYNVQEVKDYILKFISSNRSSVIGTNGYKAMEKSHPYLIVEAFKAL